MKAAGTLQILVFQGLRTQADPIDSQVSILRDLVGGQRSRIHLDTDLSGCVRRQGSQNTPKQVRGNEGRRSAAKVDRPSLVREAGKLYLSCKPPDIGLERVLRTDSHRKG